MTIGATTRRPGGEGSTWEVTGAKGTYWRGSVPLLDGTKNYFREDTQEAAEAVCKVLLQQTQSGSLLRSSALGKVKDEVWSWIETRQAAPGKDYRRSAHKPLAAGTAKGYNRALDQLICRDKTSGMSSCLGDMRVDAGQQGHIQRWMDDLMDTKGKLRKRKVDDGHQCFDDNYLSGSYLRQAYSVLSQTFDHLLKPFRNPKERASLNSILRHKIVRTAAGRRRSMAMLSQACFFGIGRPSQKSVGSEKHALPFYSPFSTKNYDKPRHATAFGNNGTPRKHADVGK